MSEIPKKYTIDNAKNDIQNLQTQNSYDFQEIKRLDGLINEYDKRVLQAINMNNQINKKIQDDYKQIQTLTVSGLSDVIDNNLYVGCNEKDGNTTRHWSGTVHKLKIWFSILSIDEINEQFGENIF